MKYPKINTVFKRNKKGRIIETETVNPIFNLIKLWHVTEKLDGTNIRVIINKIGFTINGRTDNAQIPSQILRFFDKMNENGILWEKMKKKFPYLDDPAELYPPTIIIYGEGVGPKIQKGGGNYGSGAKFIVFDIKIGKYWLKWADVVDICEVLGFEHVPVKWMQAPLDVIIDTVKNTILKSAYGDFIAEGLVFKTDPPLFDGKGDRIIGKLKVRDFK